MFTANTALLFEAETLRQKIGGYYLLMSQFLSCRYKLLELLGYVAMGVVPALVILSMVRPSSCCERLPAIVSGSDTVSIYGATPVLLFI